MVVFVNFLIWFLAVGVALLLFLIVIPVLLSGALYLGFVSVASLFSKKFRRHKNKIYSETEEN